MNEMISLLHSILHLHLNRGQHFRINTPEVFMSAETLSSQSLSNKLIEQVPNARIRFPTNVPVNLNGSISIEVSFFSSCQ